MPSCILNVLDADALGAIVGCVGSGDLLPLALTCTPFRDLCMANRKTNTWKTIATSSKSRLEWALCMGAKPNTKWCISLAERNEFYLISYLHTFHKVELTADVLNGAVKGGHLDILKMLRSIGIEWDGNTCFFAAMFGHLAVLQWAREHGCPWDARTSFYAALNGDLAMLQWAREHGCRWNEWTCSSAAANGDLAVLQWAREHGCPWNENTCYYAARRGHLAVLQYAHEHGCPWDARTSSSAAANGDLAVLQWAREHGCPWNKAQCLEFARNNDHTDIVKWIESNDE